ncbi:unnamed protein product [Calypogeia fissa]
MAASVQAAAGSMGMVAMQSPTTVSSLCPLAHLQLGRASRLSSHRQFVQFTVVDNGSRSRRSQRGCLARCALKLQERSYSTSVVKGTERAVLEDTVSIFVDPKGVGPSFFGVFDGHGGTAVAKLLQSSFWPLYKKKLAGSDPVKATTSAYEEFDQLTLAQPKGVFGALRERGVGGSRCGSTAATVVFLPAADGKQLLVAANVGDSRIVLSRGGTAIQLTFDHKPDVEAERKRIEAKNPVPKKPLVVNVGGTWRVGGLLALSRAFGDVYLKDWSDGTRNGARGGFGLTAEPHVTVETLVPEDEFLILGTDGLWEFISNEDAVNMVRSAGADKPLEDTVSSLVKLAQDRGTTDDIAVVIVRPF